MVRAEPGGGARDGVGAPNDAGHVGQVGARPGYEGDHVAGAIRIADRDDRSSVVRGEEPQQVRAWRRLVGEASLESVDPAKLRLNEGGRGVVPGPAELGA